MLKLFGYWRSTAAYRVRIALHLKNIEFENISVHLVKDGGEQHKAAYRELNPQGLVPFLIDDNVQINQSLAMLEYLDEKYPKPSIIPESIELRAKVRAFSQTVAADIHPLNNLRVLQYLNSKLGVTADDKDAWYAHWIAEGFGALENQLTQKGAHEYEFSFGSDVTMADICLVAQIYNANRFSVNMDAYPVLNKINQNCLALEAFQKALPENQPDAVK